MKIIKRDGREQDFNREKIVDAIWKAVRAVGGVDKSITEHIADEAIKKMYDRITVEEVQDLVEKELIERGHAKTAKAYILYRAKRTRQRETQTELMEAVGRIMEKTDRDNANIGESPSSKMLQIASAASKDFYLKSLLPEEMAEAHINGDIHIHDLDYYSKTINCLQIDLKEMLQNGFNTGYGFIRPPKRIASATALAAIILQSSQNDMYGGQSFPAFDYDMGEVIRTVLKKEPSYEECFQAMEALVYNLNSMHSRAGNQVPFSSINLGTDTSKEGQMVSLSLLNAFEKGLGKGEAPIFPNFVFKVKSGVNLEPETPNHFLLQKAVEIAATQLNPTFSFLDASFNRGYDDEVAYMGCRTRVIDNYNGECQTKKRGNIGFVTINLPRLAIKAKGDVDKFFGRLNQKIVLAIFQLKHRYDCVAQLKVENLPFLMQQNLYMGTENLNLQDSIEPAIRNGTLSVGFIGLGEALTLLTGDHHGVKQNAQELGEKIVKEMRELCDGAKELSKLNYTLVATPAEGLAGRFVKIDREKYGKIEGVTDKDYYTNSFHVPVDYPISAFEKIKREGVYHKYTNGGHISYVELSAPPKDNSEAVFDIISQMFKCDVGYGGINYPLDICNNCKYKGVIEKGCPTCGNHDIRRIRRITGYLSTIDRFNEAKKSELYNRYSHL